MVHHGSKYTAPAQMVPTIHEAVTAVRDMFNGIFKLFKKK